MEAALHDILINTYNADPQLRSHAETALKAFIATEGALFALISFLGNQSIHRDLRQAAGIIVKNRISEIWREADLNDAQSATPLPKRLSAPEKETARQQLVNILLVETDNSIRGLIAESIKSVAEFDYPERWPDLMPTLLGHIQTPDVLKMYNALLAIRKLVKRYEFKST